ncbi:hypothetical protein DOY81_008389 [Sarcophaga bullata]|nr:hypothetical protein DOY81_008389 [Sarcophaga bullata]
MSTENTERIYENTNRIVENTGRLYENVYYKKIKPQEKAPTDLLKQTQEQVEELVEILHDNVDKALERDNKLSELSEISENLEKSASTFKTQAVVVKRNQRWKHMKTKLVFAGVAAVILIIIILILIQTFIK